ncbi:MAG TPA: zf-HC2 domain-containing protein [Pyrinomonadaceae bacterium]|nr:zf-HC2 domain-containing protein [Pyrinomonadaceae bacterium]
MKEANGQSCAREHELIGFLYGELNEVETLAFQRHLNQCPGCSMEVSGFRGVRESVVAWRNESLGKVNLSEHSARFSPAPLVRRNRSALAAMREFLNLSPLWMKGAVAFAAVVFCVLAIMAVAGLRDKPPVVVVAGPTPAIHSQEEIDAIVNRRVQDELARLKQPRSSEATVAVTNDSTQVLSRAGRGTGAHGAVYSARRPLSKTEREQLAADLRLLSSNNDSDLELLQDTINQ